MQAERTSTGRFFSFLPFPLTGMTLLAFLLFSPLARGQEVKKEIWLILEAFTSLPDQADVVAPVLKDESPIAYPEEAAREGIGGTVKLKLLVAADGSIAESEVLDNGGDPRLLRAAVEGLRRAGCTPGTIDGRPTEMWVMGEVTFTAAAVQEERSLPEWNPSSYSGTPVVQGYNGVTGGRSNGWDSFKSKIEEPIYDPDDIPPLLQYPETARQYGLEGQVTLYVEIDTNGAVLQAKVLKSSSKLFERSALEAIRKLEFLPGTENGREAKMWKQVLVEFRLSDAAKEEEMFGSGMDDFIPGATSPSYSEEQFLALVEQEFPEPLTGHKVVLSARIDTNGAVMRTVVRSTTDKRLEGAAVNAVKKLTFTPGRQNDHPVRLWVTIKLDRTIPAVPETTALPEKSNP